MLETPVFFNKLSSSDKEVLKNIAIEMISKESEYLSYKKNAGKLQENIKFPSIYRERINDVLLGLIGSEVKSSVFEEVHSNAVFLKNEESNPSTANSL